MIPNNLKRIYSLERIHTHTKTQTYGDHKYTGRQLNTGIQRHRYTDRQLNTDIQRHRYTERQVDTGTQADNLIQTYRHTGTKEDTLTQAYRDTTIQTQTGVQTRRHKQTDTHQVFLLALVATKDKFVRNYCSVGCCSFETESSNTGLFLFLIYRSCCCDYHIYF